MNKFLKAGLWAAGGTLAAMVAVVGYVAATFNPNDYKPLIVKLVQEKKQRTLKLDGDIKLAFFPKLGADLGKVSLSEHNSTQEFAAVDSAKVYLSLWPLLKNELVIDRISIDGLRAHLVRYKDGSTSIDDLLKKDEKQEEGRQFKFDIDSVSVTRSALIVDDEKAGRKLTVSPVEFNSGRLASGVPTKIELNLGMQSDKPRADFKMHLVSGLLLNLDAEHYKLDGLKLTVKGQLGADPLELKLDAPDVDLAPDKELRISQLKLDLESRQGENAVKGQLATPLNGNMESQVFDLPGLALDLTVGKAGFLGGKLAVSLKGGAAVDLKKESAQLNLNGRIDESSIQARLGLSHFAQLAYHFDVAIDKLDVDRYLPAKAKRKKQEAAGTEKPFDLSALKGLNAGGGLRIGALKASNLKVSNLRVELQANEGKLQVSPISANLYQGTLNGSLGVDARGAVPQVTAQQKLAGASIGPLMKDLLDKEMLDGRGNVSLDLTTAGNTVGSMKRALNGNAAIILRDGAIRGINIGAALRNAKARLGTLRGQQTVTANEAEKTDFTELSGTFKVRNGVAHNDDLSAKSPLLRLTGNGDIDIGNGSVNYLAKAVVVGTLEGQGGKELSSLKGVTVPVRISGPFDKLSYALDFNAMVGEAARQKMEEKKAQIKSRAGEELQKGLKGLFK